MAQDSIPPDGPLYPANSESVEVIFEETESEVSANNAEYVVRTNRVYC